VKQEQIITALDIGTTKICCIISTITENDQIEIRGIGETKSYGLSRGVVSNIRQASESILKAIEEAERMADLPAENIFVGIAGEHIKSYTAKGIVKVTGTKKYPTEITEKDVEKVKEDAKHLASIGNDRKIIHVMPMYYTIDNRPGIKEPVGMSGNRLEADVYIITADINSVMNIYHSIDRIEYKAKDLVLESIASSSAVLDEDEKELGALLIDIGGGSADIAVYHKQNICFTEVIPFGGQSITNDIAIGLRTPNKQAELIKIKYGHAIPEDIDEGEIITVPGIGGREGVKKTRKFIAEIINPRITEILEMTYKKVKDISAFKALTAGVIITGGASKLKGTDLLGERIFNMPVQIGYPRLDNLAGITDSINDPRFSTAIGLLYLGKENFEGNPFDKTTGKSLFELIWNRMKELFRFEDFV